MDDTDTPNVDMLVSAISYGNSFFAPLEERDLLLLRIPGIRNNMGFVIPLLTRNALWWDIKRYYEAIAKIAMAVTLPNVVDPLSLPVPDHDAIPGRLFDALTLPRPRILTAYNPNKDSPLDVFFRSATDAIAVWNKYREVGQAAIGFLLTAHERITLLLYQQRMEMEEGEIEGASEMPGLEEIFEQSLMENVSFTPPPTPILQNNLPLPPVPIQVAVFTATAHEASDNDDYDSDEPSESDYDAVVSDDDSDVDERLALAESYSRMAISMWANMGVEN
ncbi:hypothetical protein CVT24_001747 [Panaeolus cyanescens]|uniref:Uncharacterized protein n=1 Tax=Panaeolus cyanescens TaxID=181874 RepID=A0A409WJ41_9AGAR|nr:hypothetical protein CVT24_001747 [Panaeolus cyanescens]